MSRSGGQNVKSFAGAFQSTMGMLQSTGSVLMTTTNTAVESVLVQPMKTSGQLVEKTLESLSPRSKSPAPGERETPTKPAKGMDDPAYSSRVARARSSGGAVRAPIPRRAIPTPSDPLTSPRFGGPALLALLKLYSEEEVEALERGLSTPNGPLHARCSLVYDAYTRSFSPRDRTALTAGSAMEVVEAEAETAASATAAAELGLAFSAATRVALAQIVEEEAEAAHAAVHAAVQAAAAAAAAAEAEAAVEAAAAAAWEGLADGSSKPPLPENASAAWEGLATGLAGGLPPSSALPESGHRSLGFPRPPEPPPRTPTRTPPRTSRERNGESASPIAAPSPLGTTSSVGTPIGTASPVGTASPATTATADGDRSQITLLPVLPPALPPTQPFAVTQPSGDDEAAADADAAQAAEANSEAAGVVVAPTPEDGAAEDAPEPSAPEPLLPPEPFSPAFGTVGTPFLVTTPASHPHVPATVAAPEATAADGTQIPSAPCTPEVVDAAWGDGNGWRPEEDGSVDEGDGGDGGVGDGGSLAESLSPLKRIRAAAAMAESNDGAAGGLSAEDEVHTRGLNPGSVMWPHAPPPCGRRTAPCDAAPCDAAPCYRCSLASRIPLL